MEALLIGAVAQYVIPLLGMIITGLAAWGVAVLKKKVSIDVAKTALDQVDRIVGTVVGDTSQTMAKELKAMAADGKLTGEEKAQLKQHAIEKIETRISTEVARAAGGAVDNLHAYITEKIEERVFAAKAGTR